jgi:gliding motility-associated-like protein
MLKQLRFLFSILFTLSFYVAYSQQDVDLHLNATLLSGKNILKIKRDFHDPYLWVLAQNNEVYRVNSITNAIDDYTSQFRAYSSLQFVDIAGRSQDTVFIATNSTNLIEYKKGVLKVIGTTDGIPGVLNSIIYGPHSQTTILIGTANGMCHYDYQLEAMAAGSSSVLARVFETTYRTDLFSVFEDGVHPDPVPLYNIFTVEEGLLGGNIWYGSGGFGNTLHTAYCTDNVVIDNYQNYSTQSYYPTDFMDFFWGTETGLFQNYRAQSNYSGEPQRKYLTGVSVNKITSIFGLRTFGTSGYAGLIKENLLVGTDQGLYFSNSGYFQKGSAYLPQYTFFHDGDLGLKKINDICVNATSYTSPTCEDGIWIAAVDGLYLLKPDYGAYINPAQKISGIAFAGANANATSVQICSGVAAIANIINYAYGNSAIQWYKDGQSIPNQSGTSLSITQTGNYNAILYDPCSPLHFETNHLQVTQIAAPVFTFNYPDTLNYCDGTSATLKTDNDSLYQYRWYKDSKLNGNTAATLTTNQSGKYNVEVSACSGTWVGTKTVQVNFIKVPQPLISTDKAAYCAGQVALLTAKVPIDTTNIINWQPYLYRWYTNGVLNGNATATLKVAQPGRYKVEVTSCSGVWIASQDLTPIFITVPDPVITPNKLAYCIGDQPILTTNVTNTTDYTVNWFLNGSPLLLNINQTSITANQTGNYTVSLTNNLSGCSQLSIPYSLNFDAAPRLSITQIVNTTLCDGQSVTLQVSHSAGSIKWSTGDTTNTIIIKHSGTYTATLTNAAGCTTSQSLSPQFLPKPTLVLTDASLCQFTNEAITLSAPTGFNKYVWNGQTGGSDFKVNLLGAVTLTVTDKNGCTATQTVHISSHCADIHIPTAFTPNGDGTNDKWVIAGLENDLSVTLKIYDRLGDIVYKSNGYPSPWDGTYNGKKLPPGVYYYIINARDNKQVLSGSVTILY